MHTCHSLRNTVRLSSGEYLCTSYAHISCSILGQPEWKFYHHVATCILIQQSPVNWRIKPKQNTKEPVPDVYCKRYTIGTNSQDWLHWSLKQILQCRALLHLQHQPNSPPPGPQTLQYSDDQELKSSVTQKEQFYAESFHITIKLSTNNPTCTNLHI